ncbi:hypothetical protein BASA81_006482 [Batrachochytrium salamandrivorans]|nr:hypothetical protein BASA81_006482 [Batrachochytrium salamandrivorans]
MKLRVRHLPAASTEESVSELLEQAMGQPLTAAEGIQLLLPISQGKPATFTKAEVLSTAYLVVANEQVASKVHKKLQLANLLVDLAPQQTLPKTTTTINNNPAAGTWKTDKEYLMYVQSKQVAKSGIPIPTPPPTTEVVSPMLAHMLKELAKRKKRQATVVTTSAASGSTPAHGGKPAASSNNKNKKSKDVAKPKQQQPPRQKRNQSSATLQ